MTDEVLLLFCDACVSTENPLLIGIGFIAVKAEVQKDCIRPLNVQFIYKENRTLSHISEAPFYELFSITSGLAYLERAKAKDEKAIVFNDCSGTIDLLSRVNRPCVKVSFKHKSLYMASIGEAYNNGIGFYWLKRNNKGIVLADMISKTQYPSLFEMSEISGKIIESQKNILEMVFPLDILDSIPNS